MSAKSRNGKELREWISKRFASYEEFSRKAGIGYNTVVKWTQGVRPSNIARTILKQKFPDCPIAKE